MQRRRGGEEEEEARHVKCMQCQWNMRFDASTPLLDRHPVTHRQREKEKEKKKLARRVIYWRCPN